ncbi:hypothetical protein [Methylomonas sp. 11b]|uniref:hypothetical protein n=1 Tax=Methylomonas sp. 11b TaxID=1168169 RepID=UPI0004B0B6C6|nr:hypothetical protein [Methylomonas sp. 11b]
MSSGQEPPPLVGLVFVLLSLCVMWGYVYMLLEVAIWGWDYTVQRFWERLASLGAAR